MSNLELAPVIIKFEEWLTNRNLNPTSIHVYSTAVKKFLYESIKTNQPLNLVDTYNEFLFEHAIKKRSVYFYDALKLFIKYYYVDDAKTSSSLLRNLLKPKVQDPKRHVHYLDDKTREGVISLMKNYKHRIMAHIQNNTGVRAGDILRLKRGSISYEAYQNKIVVMRIDFEGKGGKSFIKWIFDINLQNQIDLFLKGNLLDTEYYFLERRVNKWDAPTLHMQFHNNYRNYWEDLKQALKFYGIEYKEWATHDFRRSFARNVWDQTHDPVVLKNMLDHAQFDTTLRYLRGSGLQTKDVYYQMNEKTKEDDA